jgi:addiction module RelE/StbE family toxin
VRLVWSRRAEQDFADIVDFIARDDPVAAIKAGEAIAQEATLLKNFPEMGRRGRVKSTRELVIGSLPYIAAYRVGSGVVEIVSVLHGSQQWPPVDR